MTYLQVKQVDTQEEDDMDMDVDLGRGQETQQQRMGGLGAPITQLKSKSGRKVSLVMITLIDDLPEAFQGSTHQHEGQRGGG